ncbi:MAG TPA: DUF72 domain-containing protein [Steroidobacteraceae bacterium]|nr:DUF72 domain-containing protein [Steroidobacteraceae bacterium]
MASGPAIRIGVSGWRYAPWRGNFYPKGLPQKDELAFAARRFPTVEINGSFYSLQTPRSWQAWYAATPPQFVFAVKGPRYVTHMLRLQNIEKPLANFFASGVFRLREKLGPILWQLPASFPFEETRLANFLALLPRDLASAAALARRRDAFMRGRSVLAIDTNRTLRHALEARHESFTDPRSLRLLRRHNVALVISESAGRWPMWQEITADFLYLRLHGDKELYRSGYGPKALTRWAGRIEAWTRESSRLRCVYCYFDNTDDKLRAPADAQTLSNKLGVRWQPAAGSPDS